MLRLHTQVRHLEQAHEHELARGNRLAAELRQVRADLESLQSSIYAACAGTGTFNAHGLREELEATKAQLRAAQRFIAEEHG